MATFKVLKGDALGKAIEGRGEAIATFTEKEHQLAYSAIAHLEEHNDAKYVNALYAVTPVNYRAGLRAWVGAFAKAKFEKESQTFVYAKGKESNLEKALEIAPANYAKEANAGAGKAAKSLMERVESAAKKVIEDEAASRDDKAFARALNNFLAMHKRALTQPKAEKPAKPAPRLIKAKPEATAEAKAA